MKKEPYTCIRCGYTTTFKGNMSKHLYKLEKPCPATSKLIELTAEIKKCILDNRIYHLPKEIQQPNVINQTINNYNTMNNFLNTLDTIHKIDKFVDYSKIDLLDFQDKVDEKYYSRVKKLNDDKFRYGFELNKENFLEVLDEVSIIIDGEFDKLNIIFDEKLNKLKIYEAGTWETFLLDNGIKKILIIIQNSYLDAYECYLLKKINFATAFNKQKFIELLSEYYKFIGCFDIDPYIKDHNNGKILNYPNDNDNSFSIQEEYIKVYKNIYDNIPKSETNRFKKEVINIIKRNSQHNISELNKKMINLINIDEEFKCFILDSIANCK